MEGGRPREPSRGVWRADGAAFPRAVPLTPPSLAQHFLTGRLAAGHYGEVSRVILPEDVAAYAALLGDDNPVHLDAAFAATTRFRRPIAHGMLSAGLIPTIFGAQIQGSLYVSQTLKFKRPVYVGDAVLARVTVRSTRPQGGGAGEGARGGSPTLPSTAGAHSSTPSARAAAPRGTLVTCDTVVVTVVDGVEGAAVIEGEATVLVPPHPPQ